MGNPVRVCQDFVQGDSFIIKISHNPVIDLTGGSFELTLKNKESANKAALSVTFMVPAGADATNGIANVLIPATATAKVTPGKYIGSLKRTLADGSVVTLIRTGMNDALKVTCYKNLKG